MLRWMMWCLILMDEDQKMIVLKFSTDAMKGVVNDVKVDGADGWLKKVWNPLMLSKVYVLFNDVSDVDLRLEDEFNDVEVDSADGCLKKVRVLMHIGVDVLLLNDVHLELEDDVHLELEDDDHDVISPLSFKVVIDKLMRCQMR